MELVNLHNMIVNAEDLRSPVRLSDQLTGSTLDANVKKSMMQLLQVRHENCSGGNRVCRCMPHFFALFTDNTASAKEYRLREKDQMSGVRLSRFSFVVLSILYSNIIKCPFAEFDPVFIS